MIEKSQFALLGPALIKSNIWSIPLPGGAAPVPLRVRGARRLPRDQLQCRRDRRRHRQCHRIIFRASSWWTYSTCQVRNYLKVLPFSNTNPPSGTTQTTTPGMWRRWPMKGLRTSLNTILTQAMAMEAMDLKFDSNAHLSKKQFLTQIKRLPLVLYFLFNSICIFVFWSPIPWVMNFRKGSKLRSFFHWIGLKNYSIQINSKQNPEYS